MTASTHYQLTKVYIYCLPTKLNKASTEPNISRTIFTLSEHYNKVYSYPRWSTHSDGHASYAATGSANNFAQALVDNDYVMLECLNNQICT